MLVLLMALVMVSEAEQPVIELTRAEEHRIARESKARNVAPPQRNFLEKGLYEMKERRLMERFSAGVFNFHPLVGGMRSGAGFSLGTSYEKGPIEASAQASFKGYQKYQVGFTTPAILNERVFAKIRAEYRNYSQETFFGVGNDSSRKDRSNYRLEDHTIASEVGVRLSEAATISGNIGYIKTHIGQGTGTTVPALSLTSYGTALPAYATQPRYVKAGAAVDVDTRDEAANPRSGGRYFAEWAAFNDQNLGAHSFDRLDVELQHYIPFLNQRRVIALRARTALTHTASGQGVPFYMLPALGGSGSLRGFSEFRFRDKHMVVLNAEYRWEAFSGLDMALFADAGQVASRMSDFAFREMKTAGGIGFRFNSARKVFCRIDVGFSQEGPRIHMNFGHVF
jgi:outer membrane protein assembly factor BamA